MAKGQILLLASVIAALLLSLCLVSHVSLSVSTQIWVVLEVRDAKTDAWSLSSALSKDPASQYVINGSGRRPQDTHQG